MTETMNARTAQARHRVNTGGGWQDRPADLHVDADGRVWATAPGTANRQETKR